MVNSPQRPKAPEAQARPSSGRRRRATSYDVARLAGVSQSAVSRCFKPGASVSKAMRSKVMRAAETLHYRPNAIARGLITQRSHLIAVLVSGRLNFDYPEVLFRLTEALSARGLRVLLFTVDSEADAEGVIEQAWQFQVDGVISASHLSRRQYETLTQRQVPVVFFNRYFTNMPTDIVYCDPARQVGELVERLVGLGHSRFALIRGPKANMVSQERERLVEAALADQNVNGPAAFFGDFSYESGALAADALLTGSEPPTAIICANDMMAMGCLDQTRHRLGRAVPGDVSIASFDGTHMSQFASYEITTIRQPIVRMCEAAVELMSSRAHDPGAEREKRVFEAQLLPGSSIAEAPA